MTTLNAIYSALAGAPERASAGAQTTHKATRRHFLSAVVFVAMATNLSFGATIDFKNAPNGVWSTGINSSNVVLTPSGGGTLNAQQDTHYTLIKLPAGCGGVTCQETNIAGDLFGPTTYLVLGGNGTYPLNGAAWVRPNDANSSWIGPRADQRNPVLGGLTYDNTIVFASDNDFYVYRAIFNLSLLGIDPATANLSLGWLSDDSGASAASAIRMCSITTATDITPCASGTTVPGSGNSGQSSANLTTVNITSGFTSGYMALDFLVYNSIGSDLTLNTSGMNVSILSATGQTPGSVPEPTTFGLIAAGLIGLGLFARHKA